MNGTDTDITPQEMQRLSEALKNPEFKSLFLDYVNEISDPENKKLYESELVALEAEQGRDLTFVNPEPHFVVKTTDGLGIKVFINICSSDAINEAVAKKSGKGSHWSIPYSLGSPRDDVDAANKECKVYDVVFHSKTLDKCKSDARFKDLIISTAIEGIEKQFKIKLDKKFKLPKLKVKGIIPSTVIRVKKESQAVNVQETSSEFISKILENQEKKMSQELQKSEQVKTENKVPEYTIVHQGVISDYTDFTNSREKAGTRPDVLVVKIKLPKIESISQIELDTFEKCVELNVPGIYEVVIPLPFSVVHDKGTAKFDKGSKELSVSLPVIKPAVTKPEKVLIEEVEDEEQDSAGVDAESSSQETEQPAILNENSLEVSLKEKNDEEGNQRTVPIFHMRQDGLIVSFMIPQQIKEDDAQVQFAEDSVIFDYSFGYEGYRLHVKFQDKILVNGSKLDIQESYALIVLKKEVEREWDLITVYSKGKEFNRKFSKTMSDAENELWNNPSEILRKGDACTEQDDFGSHVETAQNCTAIEMNNLPVSEAPIPPEHEGEQLEVIDSQGTINNKGDSANHDVSEASSPSINQVANSPSAVAEIIKNSYLFDLDD